MDHRPRALGPIMGLHHPLASLSLSAAAVVWALLGLVVGSVVAALELNPAYNYHTFLYLSFASGSVGLWSLVAVVAAWRSTCGRRALVTTTAFLVAVWATYYLVRYCNHVNLALPSSDSVNDLMASRASMGQVHGWGRERSAMVLVMLAGCVAMGVVAWGLVRFRHRRAFWAFALVPLTILTFETTGYYVPMVAYVHIGLVPAVVDVVSLVVMAALLTAMDGRDRAPELLAQTQ